MLSTSDANTRIASWTAGPSSVVTPASTTSAPAQAIARLEIRDSTGATLPSAAPSQLGGRLSSRCRPVPAHSRMRP